MSRDSFFILIIGFFALTPVVLNEVPQILEWSSLTFSQLLMYAPILLLWLVSLILIGIELVSRQKRKS